MPARGGRFLLTLENNIGKIRDSNGFFLASILVVSTWNYLDRAALGILQEPIKHEFGLSDFQLGLLGGPAFAMLYVTMGLPFARLAERFNRVRIISAAFAVWSVMTALCGMAGGFISLLLARAGVSVGEAGCGPSAQSLIADRFPPERRPLAAAVYMSGVSLGSLIAAIGGGAIAQWLGWRMTFYTLGATGIICAIVFGLTVPEARRTTAAEETPDFGAALRFLAGHRLFRHVAISIAIAATLSLTTVQYLTSFYMRTYHLGIRDAAMQVALIAGAAGAVGTYLGGFIGNRLMRRNPGAPSAVVAWAYIAAMPLFILGFLAPRPALATILLMLGTAAQSMYFGPTFAELHAAAGARMRATATAIVFFISNLLGYATFAPLVGAVSDALAGRLAEGGAGVQQLCSASSWLNAACEAPQAGGLQWTLCLLAVANLWAAYHFRWIARYRNSQQAAPDNVAAAIQRSR